MKSSRKKFSMLNVFSQRLWSYTAPLIRIGLWPKLSTPKGFSVVEVILASAIFLVISSGAIFVTLQGFDANRTGSEETIANDYAAEGIEAVRSIQNQSYANLVDTTTTTGVVRNANVWTFGGTNNTFGKYTRTIAIADVYRDTSGNIVTNGTPGSSLDPNTKKITTVVSWNVTLGRHDSVTQSTYLTNWSAPALNPNIAYLNGSSTAVGTSTNIGSLATSLPNSNNLIVVAVNCYAANLTDHTIAANNLILENGSTTLASNAYKLQFGNIAARTNVTYYFTYKDSGATANPTYNVLATATGSGVSCVTQMAVVGSIAQSQFTNGSSTSLSTTETSLGTVTMGVAGDNIIIAAVQLYNAAASGTETINPGALKITSGGSTLASNTNELKVQNDGGDPNNFPSYSYLLIYRDSGASANKIYDIRASETSNNIKAQAYILVFNGVTSAYEDTSNTTISTSSDTTIGNPLNTTFPPGTNTIIVGHETDDGTGTTGTINAGNQKLKNGSGSTLASNPYDLTIGSGSNKTSGLIYQDIGAGVNPSYSVTDLSSQPNFTGAAKILIINTQ